VGFVTQAVLACRAREHQSRLSSRPGDAGGNDRDDLLDGFCGGLWIAVHIAKPR
jgi:hypothetical protein